MNQYPPQYPTQYLPPQYPQAPGMAPMYTGPVRRRIRRVGPFSAAKVLGMMTALFYAIFGLIFLVFGVLCSGFLATLIPATANGDRFSGSLAGGLIGSVVIYLVSIVFGFIFGFIIGAIYAWIYNLSVGLTGGIEVDVA